MPLRMIITTAEQRVAHQGGIILAMQHHGGDAEDFDGGHRERQDQGAIRFAQTISARPSAWRTTQRQEPSTTPNSQTKIRVKTDRIGQIVEQRLAVERKDQDWSPG